MNRFLRLLVLTLFVSLFFVNQEAHAYVNPGSGSYIFQTIVGGILSIIYAIKKIFCSLFSCLKKTKDEDEEM